MEQVVFSVGSEIFPAGGGSGAAAQPKRGPTSQSVGAVPGHSREKCRKFPRKFPKVGLLLSLLLPTHLAVIAKSLNFQINSH